MSNILKKLKYFGLLAVSFSLFGCPNAQEIASSLSKALDNEQIEYRKLLMVKDQRGETSADVLENWAAHLSNVNGRTAAIVARLEKYPQERQKAEVDLQILEARAARIYQRESQITLTYIPSWKMTSATNSIDKVQRTLLDLQRNYQHLFGKDPAVEVKNPEIVSFELKVDEELYDTYNDCVDRMKLFGVAHSDETCETEGRSRCGHQMDVDCINKVLLLNAMSACSVDVYDKENTRIVATQSAPWLDELNRCRSSSLILRPSAGARN